MTKTLFTATIQYQGDKPTETITKYYDWADMETANQNALKRFATEIITEEHKTLDYATSIAISIEFVE